MDLKTTSDQALALLNNAKALSVYREQRPLARDVIAACKLLVAGTGLDSATPFLDELEMAIPGKMRDELLALFFKTRQAIVGAAGR
jgi:hypothetical protein